jgi:WhiB family transcriptional regulator, redox-sensing transcriptional regulator
MSWENDAACRDTDPDIWFAFDTSDRTARHNQSEAKRICFGCPVIDDCLDYALEHNISDGVWGGLNERERRRVARARRREPRAPECGTRGGYHKHRRAGEVACEPCREANREYCARRRAS